MALDFIGPLPSDNGYDCILSMTDHLGSDVCIILTTMKATAKDVTLLVFNHWYCKNGLPLDFVSNSEKLFMSHFWKALFQLIGVKLKMSTNFPWVFNVLVEMHAVTLLLSLSQFTNSLLAFHLISLGHVGVSLQLPHFPNTYMFTPPRKITPFSS